MVLQNLIIMCPFLAKDTDSQCLNDQPKSAQEVFAYFILSAEVIAS